MDAARAFVAAAAAVAVLAGGAAGAVDPDDLQFRYDRARGVEERELAKAKPDPSELRRARREIAWAEANDFRPGSWRLSRQVPRPALPPGATTRARNVRSHDQRLASQLEDIGRDYGGWAAFWVHDLRTGSWAGWNSDARFPAASTVKLGVQFDW